MSIEQLFRRHYRPLCLYAAHYLDDIDTAEDVVMDCFVRFAEKVDNGEEPVSPKSYLYGMTRNACIDHARRNPIRNAAASDVELEAMACDDSELQERSEREARLWTEIDSLPTMCRTVFLMSKRDGKRHNIRPEIQERYTHRQPWSLSVASRWWTALSACVEHRMQCRYALCGHSLRPVARLQTGANRGTGGSGGKRGYELANVDHTNRKAHIHRKRHKQRFRPAFIARFGEDHTEYFGCGIGT